MDTSSSMLLLSSSRFETRFRYWWTCSHCHVQVHTHYVIYASTISYKYMYIYVNMYIQPSKRVQLEQTIRVCGLSSNPSACPCMYVCSCLCVCVFCTSELKPRVRLRIIFMLLSSALFKTALTQTLTHTHTHGKYMYRFHYTRIVSVYVFICLCMHPTRWLSMKSRSLETAAVRNRTRAHCSLTFHVFIQTGVLLHLCKVIFIDNWMNRPTLKVPCYQFY